METKLCRLCGKLGQNFLHIFKTEGLRNKIETCLPITVSPFCLLPDTICEECTENVNKFYIFVKTCLQNIIILEARYDIQESCLKSKQKKDKSCYADLSFEKCNRSIQTDENLDILSGYKFDLKEYGSKFPLTTHFLHTNNVFQRKPNVCLVDYNIDTDSGSEDNEEAGGVILGEKMQSLHKINTLVDSIISNKHLLGKLRYFDNTETDLISEITQRKSLKRKCEIIENRKPKIFKMDMTSRRKNMKPKKLDIPVLDFRKEAFIDVTNLNSDFDQNGIINSNDEQQDNQILHTLPQSCLLCTFQFPGPAALANHMFETHGIDMAEVVAINSAEPACEKSRKKIPNLVKISDLKRNDSIDELLPEQPSEEPPTLSPSYVCPNCPAVFTTKLDLMTHLQSKHQQQASHLCGICLQQCSSYVNMKSHLEVCLQQHQIITRYLCQVCLYGEDNFKSLENHILVHEFLLEVCKKEGRMFDPADYIDINENFENGSLSPSSKGLDCTECGLAEFDSFKEFSTHRRSKHSIFHCDLCNKFYGRNSHLWKHVNRLHKGHPSITCQLCYKTSASKYHLAQHFNKIHLTKGTKTKNLDEGESKDMLLQKFRPFDFQSVKQSFLKQEMLEQARKNQLSETEDNSTEQEDSVKAEPGESKEQEPKEIDSSHNLYTNIITNYTPPLNEGEFKCPKCSKAFHKKVLLKKHKKNCRPKMQKDLLTRCKSCARIFKDRQSLAKHLVNYHSEYVCEICKQKVQSKCEIVSHIRFQHPGCHLFCKVCKNVLRSRDDLQKHQRDHSESYICQFCGDSLPSKIKLKMHILSLHRKILSLSCGICLKLFETQHVLKNHVTLVHKDQLTPLTSCPVCGKNYGSKWKTYDHLNKSHGRIFKACKTCLEVFDNDAQLQAHCDVTQHGNHGTNVNSSALRNILTAHLGNTIKEIATNAEERSESDENDNTEQSNDDYEQEEEPSKYSLPQNAKISLLERRLLGKKVSDVEINIKNKNNSTPKKKKLELDMEQTNTSTNPQVNSSKRTVYVNSNDPSYCEICFKTWPAKKHLWQHYIRCHKSVAATVCGICLKTNDNYAVLQKHLRENHPTLLHGQGFGSNFICRICGRYHNASSKLRLHMVIHENFDWTLINNEKKESDEQKLISNGFKELKEESAGYDEIDINYESLIEQVECSSQSENQESDNDLQMDVKEESSEEEEENTEDSVLSENSMQARMLKNMKQEITARKEENPAYASSSEDSSSSFSENQICSKSESSDESESLSSQDQPTANSKGVILTMGDIFRRKPEELDSAIKSISYESIKREDLDVEEDFCEMQSSCLNENEIESAVGSIL